jgi:predicted PurR-regulated permease PerM
MPKQPPPDEPNVRSNDAGGHGEPVRARVWNDWPRLHLWEIQPLRDLIVVLVLGTIVYLGYVVRMVSVPLLFALLLAYLFEPVVQWMTRERSSSPSGRATRSRRPMSRPMAVITIIVAATLLVVVPVVGGVTIGSLQCIKLVQSVGQNLLATVRYVDRAVPPNEGESREELIERQPRYAQVQYSRLPEGLWQTLAVEASRLAPETELRELVTNWTRENAERLTGLTIGTTVQAIQTALTTGKAIGGLFFGGFLTAFFFFFFSTRFGRIIEFWRDLIPEHNRDQTINMVRKMDRVISAFVRGRLTIMVMQCMVFGFGYWIIGVPAGIVLGLVVGVLALLPYISVVGVPAAILLMFLDPPTGFRGAWWWMIGAPVVVYGIGQILDEYWLTPQIQGKATNMDAPTVLFASLAGGILAGFYGLLLAIPVAACLRIVLVEVVWPRVKDWVHGAARDPLPLGRSDFDV